MFSTLRLSFTIKNTYRANSILYSISQIPIIRKFFTNEFYKIKALKVLANIISVIWEIGSTFIGKLLYFIFMISGAAVLYKNVVPNELFLHLLFFLTIIGAIINTFMFDPTRDKYYAMILLKMDARKYTISNYAYDMLKVVVGFAPFSIIFGLSSGLPLWQCVIIPFFVLAAKLISAALVIWRFEATGKAYSENKFESVKLISVFLLLALAYGLPAIGVYLPVSVLLPVMCISVIPAAFAVKKIIGFKQYHKMYKQLLTNSMLALASSSKLSKQLSQKSISADLAITSQKYGFEFLNELFIKRHRKILWGSSKRITLVCVFIIMATVLTLHFVPDLKPNLNKMLLTYLPYFVFIMYAINRGTGFTRALFMNCDHSLLTYSFYKKPVFVLKLFRIRLIEIIKVNLLPAIAIGAGLVAILYFSGGTDNAFNYFILFISIISLSVFFSVHYLTIYYLLQPYNAATEMKSGTYQIVLSTTYFICFLMMQLKLDTALFGLMTIIFCILYSIIACLLIFKLSPKTFKLRT